MPRTARYLIPFQEDAVSTADGRVIALFGPKGSIDLGDLPADALICEQSFYTDYAALERRGLAVTHSLDRPIDTAVVFLGRSRALSQATIARALAALPPGGKLVIDGGKTEGIGPILNALKADVALDGSASRSHGRVAWLSRPGSIPPAIADWARALDPQQIDSGHWTSAGLFSADAVDPGSALLTAHFDAKLKGRAADFGGGWGALSAPLLAIAPKVTELDLIEADHRALDLARRNLTDPRAQFRWADVAELAPIKPYDLIVSNPPFHITNRADPSLGQSFVAAAGRCLSPRGTFLMVANRQLPYERAFEETFSNWQIREQTGGYKIFEASRPVRTRRPH